MTDDELTEAEQARLRALVVFQKIVLGIALRWWRLYAIVFVAVGAILSSFRMIQRSLADRPDLL